jgi:hypothetical protein
VITQSVHEKHLKRATKRNRRRWRLLEEVACIVVLEEAKAIHDAEGGVIDKNRSRHSAPSCPATLILFELTCRFCVGCTLPSTALGDGLFDHGLGRLH